VEDSEAGKMSDFSSAISQICEEKGISKVKVIETVEAALAAAYKKDYGKKGQNIKAIFDQVTGGARFFLVKEVVDETTREFVEEEDEKSKAKKIDEKEKKEIVEKKEERDETEERLPRYNQERDIILKEAKKLKKDAKVGDVVEIELEPKADYGRVAAQTAKQVVIQRIREAERDAMYDEYKSKEGEVLNGVVQRVEGRNVFVDIGKSVGVLFPSEQIERESYRIGQRQKVYLMKVDAGSKGPGITLSRIHPNMIHKLFELEVPEVFAGTVEIKSIAREAGERTKIAVASNEEGVDPIGSCVGQKGTRVQTIIDELNGEKIDIILWSDDIAKFIATALSPAKVLKVDIKEARKEATVTVPEDQLSLAIGKRGQNVRLAAKLTGWKIDIMGVSAEGETVKSQSETHEEKALNKKQEEEAETGKENTSIDNPETIKESTEVKAQEDEKKVDEEKETAKKKKEEKPSKKKAVKGKKAQSK